MICQSCNQEYGAEIAACPTCHTPLTSAGPPPTGAFPSVCPSTFDLTGSTLAVSGSSSIRSRLRPRTVWEIVGEALQLYRGRWKLFTSIALIFYGPIAVLQFFQQQATYHWQQRWFPTPGHAPLPPPGAADFLPHVPLFLAFMLVSYAALFLAVFAITRAVSDIYLGKDVLLKDVLRPDRRIWGMIGAMVLTFLILAGISSLFFAPVVLGFMRLFNSGHPSETNLGALLLIVPLAFVGLIAICLASVWFMAVAPTAVVEGKGAYGSLARGVNLIRGFYGKALGLTAICTLGYMIISYILSIPYAIAIMVSTMPQIGQNTPPHISAAMMAVGSLLNLVISTFTLPLALLPVVLFYYDLRIRKEAFDLQMLSEQLGYSVQNLEV